MGTRLSMFLFEESSYTEFDDFNNQGGWKNGWAGSWEQDQIWVTVE